jgi:hypothetical protein
MKKMMIRAAIMAAIVTVSWFALANDKFTPGKKVSAIDEAELTLAVVEEDAPGMSDDEQKILKEMQDLFSGLYDGKPLYLDGVTEFSNPADTVATIQTAQFGYYNNGGGSIQIKNGQQIAVNNASCYAVADHELKRIIVAPSKKIEPAQLVPVPLAGKNLRSEGYSISRTQDGDRITIRLLCENHITCKEIKVEFDANTRKPITLFSRYTDLDHPGETAFDKTMTVRFSTWETDPAKLGAYAQPVPVRVSGGEVAKAPGFESYDIVNLLNK